MQRFTYTILARGTGLALRDALVTIFNAGTTELATLYSENSTSSETLNNPLTSDAFGAIAAYIPNGRYDLRVDYAGQPSRTIPDVQVFDAEEFDISVGPLARITGSGNQLAYFAGTNIAGITDFYQLGRDILAIADLAELRTFLGISDALALPVAVASGGTGAADAAGARTNLGVYSTGETDAAISAAITAGSPDYLIPFGFTTTPAADEFMLIHVFAEGVTIPADFAGSQAYIAVPPLATMQFEVYHSENGLVGTIQITNTGVVTFSSSGLPITFAAGQVIEVLAPLTADGTISNCAFTLRGERV